MRTSPAALLLLVACTGTISTTSLDPEPGQCTGARIDPGPLLLRRLTNAEYLGSVNWLLGVDASAEVALFPADLRRTGFDNGFDLQTISVPHADRYHAAAKTLTTQVFADATRTTALVGCDLASGDSCLRAFLARFGRRAYRRSLSSSELDDFLALAHTETKPEDGAALATRAMLESPNFLWRVEVGEPVADLPDRRKLTSLELATRLSFFLWSAPPDDALLALAESGGLDSIEAVETQTRAMLADPRAKPAFTRFIEQWFRLDTLDSLTRSPTLFPEYDAALRSSMRRELHALFESALWGEQPLLSVYSTRRGFLDERLATLYGVSAPSLGGFASHDWGSHPDRGGLFTTAGLLTVTARNDFTSPIQRGLYVRETVLCDHLAPPAGGIPPIALMPGESREQAESRHTSDPNCTGCHALIDPVGAGLERYDALGRLRDTYPNGRPVMREGKIVGLPKEDYQGGVELGALLASSARAEQCAVQHAFRWAVARNEELRGIDACTIEQVTKRFSSSGQRFADLIVALTTHDSFRYRRAE